MFGCKVELVAPWDLIDVSSGNTDTGKWRGSEGAVVTSLQANDAARRLGGCDCVA